MDSWESTLSVLFFSWGAGYALGYYIRQFTDALNAS